MGWLIPVPWVLVQKMTEMLVVFLRIKIVDWYHFRGLKPKMTEKHLG